MTTWSRPIALADLFDQALLGRQPRGWLYLPNDWNKWTKKTVAYVHLDQYAELENIHPPEPDYVEVIDDGTLESVVRAAHEYLGVQSFAGRVQALIYYYRFDAFLPQIGAPDPPPWEEIQLRLDREFYVVLGHERAHVPCKAPGCTRGAIELSAFCKLHHFEQVRGRECPFDD